MRITDKMMANRMLTNINRNLVLLDKYSTQGSSGKKIQMASENPIVASRALRYRTIVSDTDQYLENVAQADSWAKVTETAMNNINGIVQNMRELCVQGSNDTYTTSDRAKMLTEFKSLLEQIEAEVNTTYMGRNIFSGFKTDEKPIIKDPATGKNILNIEIYGGTKKDPAGGPDVKVDSIDGQEIRINVSYSSTIPVNSLATKVYSKKDFDALHNLDAIYERITSDDYLQLDPDDQKAEDEQLKIRENIEAMITSLDEFAARLSNEHTKIGVKLNKIQLTESRLTDDKVNYKNLQSSNEDIDLADVSIGYNAASAAYSAALKIGMNINQMTLADYL